MSEIPSVEETLFRINGTLMKEGDAGKALTKIADQLEKLNWNLGAIRQAMERGQR